MAGYIMPLKWTPQGLAAVKEVPERLKQIRAEAEKLGIQSVGTWATMGEYDLVAIWDALGDQTMSTFVLSRAKLGLVTTKTMRALSEEEFAQVVSKLP
jgi:uncharacterized protein with GYD domain